MFVIGNTASFIFDEKRAFPCAHRDHYWAERGLVHVEDSDGKNYASMSVAEGARRASALSDSIKAARQAGSWTDAQVDSMLTTLERFIDVINTARRQGDPNDPAVVAKRAADFHKKVLMGPK